MAKDYLSCSASSCEPERMFSTAADVCVASQGRLLVISIERQVSCQLWLAEGVSLGDDFIKLMEACNITEYGDFVKDYNASRGGPSRG